MGLDIGIVDNIVWTPVPGWKFWDYLSPYALDVDGDSLALTNVREAFEDMLEMGDAAADDIERAREFAQWCEEYWERRGYEAEDGISIVLSY